MPCILKVHVEAARGLPAIDRTSELVDAYVEVRFADAEVQRTPICRKTLNPIWRADFRFEISDDTQLQDEPLELKVFDFDAITTDDSVGSVSIDLNPLLSPDAPNQLAGWFPIYDTIRGARGELWLQVKLEFFENINPFKDSSEGVHIFSNEGIPAPYMGAIIVGLVDMVITEVDPDYHWSDSFRTSRSSNEASQRILNEMTCRLRRQMGRKALEMGGNSILSFHQWIDIEPYAQTITIRGLGTAAIMRPPERGVESSSSSSSSSINSSSSPSHSHDPDDASSKTSIGPSSLSMNGEPLVKLSSSKEIVLSTITRVPPTSLVALGGVISTKSVRLMSEESEYGSALTRDKWLTELREEMKTHARSLGCNIVMGYREHISINDDLYLVYAEGTAARIRSRRQYQLLQRTTYGNVTLGGKKGMAIDSIETPSPLEEDRERSPDRDRNGDGGELEGSDEDDMANAEAVTKRSPPQKQARRKLPRQVQHCHFCHLPRRRGRLRPMEIDQLGSLDRCNVCRHSPVPDTLLSTVHLPIDAETFGESHLVESFVCRPLRRKKDSELVANLVSTNLPFVEYELYRQLQFKLRYHGFNAIFGAVYQFVATDKAIIAIASGMGVCLAALPKAKALQISRNIAIRDVEDKEIFELQERLAQASLAQHARLDRWYEERFPSSSSSSSSSSNSGSSRRRRRGSGNMGDEFPGEYSSTSSETLSTSGASELSTSSSSSSSESDAQSIVQIDDEADEDLILTMTMMPKGLTFGGGDRTSGIGHSDGYIPMSALSSSTSLGALSSCHFVCQFRRFTIAMEDHHPSSTLANHFRCQYEDLAAQVSGLPFIHPPQIVGLRHHVSVVRGAEVHIMTTASVIGEIIPIRLPTPQLDYGGRVVGRQDDNDGSGNGDLLNIDTPDHHGYEFFLGADEDDSDYEFLPTSPTGGAANMSGSIRSPALSQQMHTSPTLSSSAAQPAGAAMINVTHFTTGPILPNTHFVSNCGTVSLQLFKEVYYHECAGGFPSFVTSVLFDLFAMGRATVVSLGGNLLASLCVQAATIHENFKNQLHAVVYLTGDVLRVDPRAVVGETASPRSSDDDAKLTAPQFGGSPLQPIPQHYAGWNLIE